ncbi:hypothetical protein HaLaN_16821 [Haematococcus lacustris]|uniref:Uncharacterized protein n=1 Tax=Haematococcus lacustris TaxID=44745 RepID=A0A699ZB09_HAELA|nr:hypothetical protein HaLaN_16821 [Haematococcus lacustris]
MAALEGQAGDMKLQHMASHPSYLLAYTIVKPAEPMLEQFITQVSAPELCQLMGACSDALQHRLRAPAQQAGSKLGRDSARLVTRLAHLGLKPQPSAGVPSLGDQCDNCKYSLFTAR